MDDSDMGSWKEYIAKYFTNLVSILTLAGMLFMGYSVYENRQRDQEERKLLEERYGKLVGTATEYQQISDLVGQLSTTYKEQGEIAKEVASTWKDLKIDKGERIKLSSDVVVSVDPMVEQEKAADYTFLTAGSTQGYTLNELRVAGKDSPAIGYVLVKNTGETFKKNYKFEIKVESVQIKDDLTGKIRVVSRAYLVPLENGLAEDRRLDFKKWKDVEYPLKVTGGEIVVDPQEPVLNQPKSKDWVLHAMNFNGGFGVFGGKGSDLDAKVMIDTNLFGYGYSKQDLDWKLLHLGMNYSKPGGLGVHVMPFSYRPLPEVLTNTYIGPGAFWAPETSGYFLGINIGF